MKNIYKTNIPVWRVKVLKKEERRSIYEAVALNIATLIFYILFIFQFSFGAFRSYAFAPIATAFLALVFSIYLLLLVIYPKFNFIIWPPIAKRLNNKIFNLFNYIILTTYFLLTIPFARTIGRRKYLKIRPMHAPWIYNSNEWKVSTWQKKNLHLNFTGKKGFLRGIFYIFLQERNWFMLILLTFLLLISMVILFAQSSAVAPFIYSIF